MLVTIRQVQKKERIKLRDCASLHSILISELLSTPYALTAADLRIPKNKNGTKTNSAVVNIQLASGDFSEHF